ncbi:hypothetical protein MK805_12795 [Shimazuella sp. AN120528]|nr:hypothetical protein [Shimazuella soli]MCH5585819.1 hypothetical protein [Shimazuella soli]
MKSTVELRFSLTMNLLFASTERRSKVEQHPLWQLGLSKSWKEENSLI